MSKGSLFFFATLSLKPDSEVFGALKDLLHALIDKFLLFDKFLRLRVFPEFDSLDQTVLKLFRQAMRCFHFDV